MFRMQRVAFDIDDNNNDERLRTNVITTLVTDREAQELEQLESSRKYLAHRMARLEKRMKGVLYRESAAVERENRLSRLEADLNSTKEAMAFNATRQDATQDRLHGSLLELLESVENLDDRVDACLPEVRKEISKIEFTVARINASVAIIKEDQVSPAVKYHLLCTYCIIIYYNIEKFTQAYFFKLERPFFYYLNMLNRWTGFLQIVRVKIKVSTSRCLT